jgi:hypothetical protein
MVEEEIDDSKINDRDLLLRIARELKTIREGVGKALFAMGEAEKEIPEKMRRFANYFHDIVHVKGEYVTLGIPCPKWLDEEMERCHDRFRQVLHDLHTDGGHFEKVRREMANHSTADFNRYDHTRQLSPPKKEAKA